MESMFNFKTHPFMIILCQLAGMSAELYHACFPGKWIDAWSALSILEIKAISI